MAVRDIVVRLRADVRAFERDLARGGDVARRQAEAMDRVGKGAAVMGAAMAAGLLVSAKAAIEWESAWAGVTKTVDGTAEQMSILEDELRAMATALPVSAVEIAKVAESAGQLGVAREDITAFTKTMVDLSVSTNLTADEAATSIAKIANVMGTFDEGPDAIGRFGAALVALGNDGASTEADILAMATRIAGAAQLVGASESDVLALSNALSSMGVQAELGGGVMTRVLLKMYESVNSGGEALQGFADVAGVSAGEFATQFSGEPVEALDSFVQGLSRIEGEGGNAVAALKDVELQGTYNMQVLLQLKGAGDLLSDSLVLGNEAWAANAALVEEAGKRYDTTESKLKIAKNSFNELMITLGTHLLPAINAVSDGFSNMTLFLAGLPEPLQKVLVLAGALGAGLLLVGGAALILIPRIAGLQASLIALGVTAATAQAAMARLVVTMKVAAGATVIGALAAGAYYVGKSFKDAAPSASEFADGLRSFAETGKTTGVVASKLGDDFQRLAKRVDVANNNKLSLIDGTGINEVESARDILKELDAQLAALVASGNAEQAQALYERMTAAMLEQGGSVDDLNDKLPKYGDAQRDAAAATEATYDAAKAGAGELGRLTEATDNNLLSLGHWAEALGLTKEQTEQLVEQQGQWADKLAEFVQPMDAYTEVLARKEEAERVTAEATAAATKSGEDSWEDYVRKVSVSLDEYLDQLTTQVRAQQEWERNLLILSSRVSEGMLQALIDMGQEGAPIVQKFVDGSAAEIARAEPLFAAGMRTATGAAAEQLKLAGPVLAALGKSAGKQTVQQLATALAAGKITVDQIAAKYGISIKDGIITQTDLATGQVKVLGSTIDGLTTNVDVDVKTHGIGATQSELQKIETRVAAIMNAMGVSEAEARRHANNIGQAPYVDPRTQRGNPLLAPTRRSEGGPVWGEGTSTSDSIPALLSTGEYVIKASSVDRYGEDFLNAVNAGRYADGGRVRGTLPVSINPAIVRGALTPMVNGLAARAAQAGGGGLGGKMVQGVEAMMAALRSAFPGLPLNSGYRPGSITATGNRSYHASGRAVDVPPRLDVNHWIAKNYGSRTKELILTKQGAINLRNGRPHSYGEPTRSNHRDHNHWAMASGGLVRRAAGGPIRPSRPPFSGGRTLVQAAQGMDSVEAIRKLIASYDRYLERLDQAAKKQQLLADITEAMAERAAVGRLSRAEQAQARVEAQQERARRTELVHEARVAKGTDRARARRALAEHDAQQRIERQREAERLGADKAAADEKVRDAKATYYANERAVAAEREREAIDKLIGSLEEQAAAEAAAAEAAADRKQAQEDALDLLNDLLDQERDVRQKQADLAAEHAATMGELQADLAELERDHAQRITELQDEQAKGTAEHYADVARLAADHSSKIDGLLAQRTDALADYARIDEQTQRKWGASASWLIKNTIAQTREMQQWMAELATARQRGLAEGVIGALGLDEGPQALNQLRQLNQATAEEIDALNQAVVDRTAVAGEQATVEATGGYGQLGAALAKAAEEFSAQSLALQEQYAAAQTTLRERLVVAEAEFVVAQAEVRTKMAAEQAELLEQQQALAAELAAIGTKQGRDYAAALAEGLKSGLPAVQAAAKALQAMLTGQPLPGATGGAGLGGAAGGGALPAPKITSTTPAGLAALGVNRPDLAYQMGAGGSFSSIPLAVAVTMHSYQVVDGKVISHLVTTEAQQKAVQATLAGVMP